MVPDTVEELEVAADEKSLDQDIVRLKLADSDEHALEEAILLKERHGGSVTVVAFDAPEVDDVLFTALAKGANRAVKITGDWANLQSKGAAAVMARFLAPEGSLPSDALVMLRSQAIDDLEGEVGSYLAELLKVPYVGIVTSIIPDTRGFTVTKEFAGGLRGEFSVPLPAILGIQSAEKPPRYVPIAKVRAAQKSARIETVEMGPPDGAASVRVERLYKPEAAGRAQMLDGSPEDVADKIVEILAKESLI
jgi:electron transfer flavoprotein beta subunit